jgi:hypothetical protein
MGSMIKSNILMAVLDELTALNSGSWYLIGAVGVLWLMVCLIALIRIDGGKL